jgi:hypothetical protein
MIGCEPGGGAPEPALAVSPVAYTLALDQMYSIAVQ